ncbi:TPA: helix-turn-helix domain-containing protein [Escherichia fergusonii]|uniref:helix-turn-helix domain-containing protein n=1 Tax=Escherichia fergusonii TaxID=564 RepID=UPI000F666A36|nr:helix-turn-helix domain-containing protein [Escherichia fergusonii]EHG5995773.1 helix-turn-helix domain-containing protein [Escherichia fergusonii]MBA8502687.1 helix-turn-helix domain-containing protein [Escherichia fergusonii]QCZ33127.1 helix-turn-helix domain-containing protein [Escherichia fergusonii]HAI1303493.1 helix-turn-helix domain-containing protein [Escherichia fergusonii]HCO8232355.1 helix-turn-helix domain-containing protein [Escherichia fergusonii]
MIQEGLLLPVTIVKEGASLHISHQEVLSIRKCENINTQLEITQKKLSTNWVCEEDCLLLLDCTSIKVTAGKLVLRRVRIDILSKLLAFVDGASSEKTSSDGVCFFGCIPCNCSIFTDRSQSEAWFLAAYVTKQPWINSLSNLLRRTECYGLVCYLFSKSLQQASLYELGKAYGVSYSHFRRLCSHALGGKVKSEMCSWRMAWAVLELIEGKSDMTSAAYKYGYSSSSHFSAEVKNRLGKTPRELCKKS